MKLPQLFKKDHVQTAIMIAIVVLSVLIFWFGISFVLKTGNPILAVASESMEPLLYKGDLIVIEGIENVIEIQVGFKDSDQPGDIIIFHKPSDPTELIVHRAIEKRDAGDGTYVYRTQGDNERTNRFPDPWEIKEEDIVGRYLDIKVPWLGNVALFFSTFEVKVAFIALWIVIIVIVEVAPFAIKRIKRDKDEEKTL